MGRRSVGATVVDNAVEISIWAPLLESCALRFFPDPNDDSLNYMANMKRSSDGYFTYTIHNPADDVYYAIDKLDGYRFPDPYCIETTGSTNSKSRIRRHTLAAISQEMLETDASTESWPGVPAHDAVIYELHVGTATQDGTYRGIIDLLPHLVELGVTVLQLMPICTTPGSRNWGYDPTSIFSLNPAYGDIDDLKALIDATHRAGLSIIVDVVYNHLSPEGCNLPALTDNIFSIETETPWGRALNLNGPGCDTVRALIEQSVIFLIRDLGFDGLRIDAAEYLDIGSVLHNIAKTARAHARHDNALLILEYSYEHFCDRAQSLVASGLYDFVWDRPLEEILRNCHDDEGPLLLRDLHKRQHYINTGNVKRVAYARSHDTLGNWGADTRLDTATARHLRAFWPLIMLSPTTPMIFMGDEWMTQRPFHFFCDYQDIPENQILHGRKCEFGEQVVTAPSPLSLSAFERSVLDWREIETPVAQKALADLRTLIALRKEWITPHITDGARAIGNDLRDAERRLEMTWRLGNGSILRLALFFPGCDAPSPNEGETIIYNNQHEQPDDFAFFTQASIIAPPSSNGG